MRFFGKVALVTGGGTGIGAATAQRLADEGAQVVLMGRRREPLQAIAARTGAHIVQADAADTKSVRAAVADIVARFGALDLLIANAGGHGVGPTLSMSDEVWALAARTNLDTAFVCARECLPELMRARGAIVVVSSIAGLFSGPDAIGYVTMKHALMGLAKSLARDYGAKGVRTNTVCPGWVRTPMADEQMDALAGASGLASREDAYALVTKDVPLQRPATPEEIAHVICFLASPEASIVNGAVVVADGGATTVDLPTLAFASLSGSSP